MSQPKSREERASEIRKLVEAEPGIRAVEIAERTGVTKGTVSLAIRALRAADEIEVIPHGPGRGQGLRVSALAQRRMLLRKKWR